LKGLSKFMTQVIARVYLYAAGFVEAILMYIRYS